MARHEVILPLEGKLPLHTNEDFIVMGVKFFIPANKPGSGQWYASTRIEDREIRSSELVEDDNEVRIIALAYDKTELALNLLSLVIKRAISIRKDGYCIGEVDETTNRVPRYHVPKRLTAGYDIITADSVGEVKKWVDKIHNMPEEKRSVLSASLSYYREALHASNPFHSIISYFSSMSALVRGTQQGLRVYTQDLKEKIRKTIEIDENQFNGMWEKCYGNYKESSANFSRSAADHGHIDITSPQKIEEARNNIEPVVRTWSEKMIDSFINDNQVK